MLSSQHGSQRCGNVTNSGRIFTWSKPTCPRACRQPRNNRARHKTSETSLANATAGIDDERATVLLVHTGQDAEHLRPDDDRREHSAWGNITRKKPALQACHCRSRRRARLREEPRGSFFFFLFFLFLLFPVEEEAACRAAFSASTLARTCSTDSCTSRRRSSSHSFFSASDYDDGPPASALGQPRNPP